jgi:uncharacterized RDD family membrane protein YckC
MANAPLPSLDPFAPPASNLDPRVDAAAQLPATRGTRFGAAFLDGLCTLPLVIIGMVVVTKLGGGAPALAKPTALSSLILFACGLPLQALQWYLVATTGQTLGKRWLKIKIVKLDGSNVDVMSGVVLRYGIENGVALLCNMVGLTFVSGLIGFIDPLFIFRGDRRTLHDLIAGTKVITLQ